MNYEYFQSMTENEARIFFMSFINEGKNILRQTFPELLYKNGYLECKISEIENVFKKLLTKISLKRITPDNESLKWVMNNSINRNEFYQIAPKSECHFICASYYFGECFVQLSEMLSWGIGIVDSMDKNMPVIRGFKNSLDFPVLDITETVLIELISNRQTYRRLESIVRYWQALIP